jgi:RNA polymerase sigma-70 factor (ECF subfamily)
MTLVEDAPARVFDDVYRREYAPLVRALTVACGDREVAADCVQEAFVKAHLRWRRLSTYDDPVAWVRRVAINRMRDHFRREKVSGRAHRLLAAGASTHQAPPSLALDLPKMLAALPRQQRIAMSLYYVADLSVAEVAAAMLVSEGAVKFHLYEGRRRLRPLLEGGEHDV